jgi:diacylglycerol kinase family enzyme
MKTFLRVTAIIFLAVLAVVILTGVLKKDVIVPEESITEEVPEDITTEEGAVSDTEEALEDIIDPAGDEDDGVIILGGDGIPNN